MSTLCWMPSTGTAAVSPTPSGTDWNLHINTVSRPLNFANGGSTLTTLAYNPDAADHLVDGNSMVAQFVSQVIPPQAIAAQTVTISARVLEAVATNNLFLTWKLYATNIAGTSVLGTLVAIRRDGTEAATSLTGRTDSITSTAFSDPGAPFRLVLEVGLGGLPTASASTDSHNGSFSFGENQLDFPQDGDTSASNPYLLFANNLQLGVPNTAAAYTHQIVGITKDNSGAALGSCTVYLHKIVGSERVYVNRSVSDGSGNYTLGCFDNNAAYVVTGVKSGSPNVFDVSDVLTPTAV